MTNDKAIEVFQTLAKKFNQEWLIVKPKPEDGDYLYDIGDGSFSIHTEMRPVVSRGLIEDTQVMRDHYVVTSYHQTAGTYFEPPDSIESELIADRNLFNCLQFILITAIKDEINNAAECADMEEMESAGGLEEFTGFRDCNQSEKGDIEL